MAEEKQNTENSETAKPAQTLPGGTYFYGIGRRKMSSVKVRLYPGKGEIMVNDLPAKDYFGAEAPVIEVEKMFTLVGKEKKFLVSAKASGGGKASQGDALKLGVARALIEADKELRTTLKRVGYLTRDAREKERKKYGLKRARKAPQFSKR
jgi:small subunit ribosomal protein S9